MLARLPGWVVDDEASVRAEVEGWRGLTPAERWRLAVLCARDVVWAARASGNAARIFDAVEPLPASTTTALARLRERAGWGDGGR